ncbi:OmpA family protein [Brumimicrobium aurantiacum]|uniref:OmpA family protein n=1 Tax=Brumimicrobium aurantiacum TaxID=1737063 RepID=A0A3E1EZ29_9FLAO|nr:OmpA family protein [Brumimicrobium aurantiacum]RFC54820.1 OmpA family protein [Brumimicrobium aurantiacum]
MEFKTKNLKGWLFTLPVALLSLSVMAQEAENLVANPSFEDAQSRKIRRVGDIEKADGWSSASGDRADLYSADANGPDVMTPENIYGKEEAKSGVNYAGIIAYSYREKENRTYITSELTTKLKKGMRYKVQFYASLAELSKYSANRLGAHFSKKGLGTDDKVPAIIAETHVEHPKKEVFDGMYGWDLVCGEYVATGKERYITIGNFAEDSEITNDRARKPRDIKGKQIIAAYYYIDDISVQLLGPNETCECDYGDEAKQEASTIYQRSPEITKDMTLNDKISEYNIFYAGGRYDVKVDGVKTLDKIASLMKENPSMKIQITGHSDDAEAGNAAEQVLSMRRAEYVKKLLEEREIDGDRLIIEDGKNGTASKYINESDDENLKAAKNRRVTFRVI